MRGELNQDRSAAESERYQYWAMNENPYAAPKNKQIVDLAIRLPLSEAVVFDAEVLSRYQAGFSGWFRFLLRIVAAVVGALGCFAASLFVLATGPGDIATKLVIASILGVPGVLLVSWAIWARRVSVWTMQFAHVGIQMGKVKYTITAECLKIDSDTGSRDQPWSGFVGIQRTKHFLCLTINDGRVQLFPVRQLSHEFIEALHVLVSSAQAR